LSSSDCTLTKAKFEYGSVREYVGPEQEIHYRAWIGVKKRAFFPGPDGGEQRPTTDVVWTGSQLHEYEWPAQDEAELHFDKVMERLFQDEG
jgi:hypothetical protein